MATNRTLSADLINRLTQIVGSASRDETATLDSAFLEFKTLTQDILSCPLSRLHAAVEERAIAAENQVTNLQAELTDALNNVEALSTTNEEKTRLITLLSRLNPNEAPVAPAQGSSSVKIPDPPIFTDSREEWEGWQLQMQLKLRADAQRFPNATSRIAYVISRTAGRAQELLKGHVTNDGFVDLTDATDVLTILQNAYGDPDPEGTARTKLEKLRQGKHDFAWYIAQFDALTNKLRWDTRAKKDALLTGISYEIKEQLYFQQAPPDETYQQLCVRCQTIDSSLRALRHERPAPSTSRPNQASSSQSHAQTNTSTQVHQTTSNPQYLGPAPMDLSANRRRTLDPAEKARRLAEGRCLYCGGMGHMARQCPNKPGAIRAAAATLEPTPTPAPSTATPVVPTQPAGNA